MRKSHSTIFLSRSYFPNVGGVEKHIHEVSKILVRRGYRVTIITEEVLNSEKKEINDKDYLLPNVTVLRIPIGKDNWFKKFRIWKWVWENRKLFLESDIIHCHDVFFWYLPLALVYPLKPVYTTFHGYESYPIKLKAIIYRKVFEYMSNKTICVGEFMRKWYHANPTSVIYGGTNIPTKETKPKKNSAIFIGRLDEHTGIIEYVQAVKLIRKKIPSFTLTVYGDGPLKEKIRGDGIVLKGFDPNAEREIQKYEFAFVSRYLAILEAMAAKRLVFAHYGNPVKEDYLKMTPYKDWVIVFKDPAELSKRIITSQDVEDKVAKAYQWVKQHTWDGVCEVYVSLWKNTLSS